MSRHFLPGRALVVLAAAALAVMACGTTSVVSGVLTTPTTAPTATATATPTCATALPGATPINLGAGFVYPIVFPASTVGTAATQTAGGPGLYSVYAFEACTPGTSVSAVSAFFAAQLPALPHGWIATTLFPSDGGLMQPCTAGCWYDPKGGPLYYLTFDTLTDHGGGVVTYHGRYAVSPDFPNCNSNFTNSPTPGIQSFLPGITPALPLPPLTSVVPDDAAGLRGYDLCSAGTTASVTTFMQTELPATGWTKVASDARCFYTDECWTNSGTAISWNVSNSDNTDWHIAWHSSTP
jgi:hypothetical protein